MREYISRKELVDLTGLSRDFFKKNLKGITEIKLSEGKTSKILYKSDEVANWFREKGLEEYAKKIKRANSNDGE